MSIYKTVWAEGSDNVLLLSDEELSILHAVFCSGRVGGNAAVRSKLYDKLSALKRDMIHRKAPLLDGTAEHGRATPSSIVPASPVPANTGRVRRAKSNRKR